MKKKIKHFQLLHFVKIQVSLKRTCSEADRNLLHR